MKLWLELELEPEEVGVHNSAGVRCYSFECQPASRVPLRTQS